MYICFPAFFFIVFNSNISNFFVLFLTTYYLVYFLNLKNFFNIYEFNLFIEDRFVILLENIMRIEYNIQLLIILFLIFFYMLNKYFNLVIFFALFTFFYIENYFFLQTYDFIFFNSFKLNTKLLNGLFLIHPYCIYIFYSLIFFLIITCFFKKTHTYQYKLKTLYLFKQIKNINYLVLCFGTIAIMLGSWWAYQEINWNSWWSWDLIEIVNFVLIFIILSYLHLSYYEFNLNSVYLFIYFCLYTILSFLLISRYNIINSLHSFIVLNNFEQFSYYFLIFFGLFYYFIGNSFFNYKSKLLNYTVAFKFINY